MLRAGFIGGPWNNVNQVSQKARDGFVHGNSFTLSGEGPGPWLVGGAETWGSPRNPAHMFGSGTHNDFATEAGAGVGTLGVSLTWSYAFRIATWPFRW